ncbi:ArsR/SmtB family transcription factor [Nonomuraea fuscirosea]|uniref:ArsR/SmtB family transcription factor n=1 Tax=Nonomuraea fuscirosea TaxID=1291556 RepID=UPI0034467D10
MAASTVAETRAVSGLVRVLADGRERGWGELRAPVAKSTLSHHLRVLRDVGITRTRQEGTRCFAQLRRADLDARFPGLLDAVLEMAQSDDVGAHVAVRSNRTPPGRNPTWPAARRR